MNRTIILNRAKFEPGEIIELPNTADWVPVAFPYGILRILLMGSGADILRAREKMIKLFRKHGYSALQFRKNADENQISLFATKHRFHIEEDA